MTTTDSKTLFRKSFNISQNLENLINDFNFSSDPKDGIRDVRIRDITVVSPCENYNFSFVVNGNKKAIADAIKAKNISIRCLAVKELGLDVVFHDGFLNEKNEKIPIKINYFCKNPTTPKNPIIKKYLRRWGLVNAEGIH